MNNQPCVEHDQHDVTPEEKKKRHEFMEQALQLARAHHWSEFIDYLAEGISRGYNLMVIFDCLIWKMNLWGQESTFREFRQTLRDRFVSQPDFDCDQIGKLMEIIRENPNSFKQERFSFAFLEAVVDHTQCCIKGCNRHIQGDAYALKQMA
jgi:hypothetical protein